MATTNQGSAVEIPVELDEKPAAEAAKSLSQQILGALTPVVDVGDLISKAFDKVRAAFAAVVSGSIEESQKQIDAETRLTAALAQRGLETERTVARMQLLTSALQQSTGYGDDELISIQARLVALGVQSNELDRATKATIGLAQITGGSLNEAVGAIAKAEHGHAQALERMGFYSLSASDALDKLAGQMSVAEARMQTFGGQSKLVESNLSEIQETLGDGATKSKTVLHSLEQLNNALYGANIKIGELKQTMLDSEAELVSWAEKAGAAFVLLGGPMGFAAGVTAAGASTLADWLAKTGAEAKAAAKELADFGDAGDNIFGKNAPLADMSGAAGLDVDPEKRAAAARAKAQAAAQARRQRDEQIRAAGALATPLDPLLSGSLVNPLLRGGLGDALGAGMAGQDILNASQAAADQQEALQRDLAKQLSDARFEQATALYDSEKAFAQAKKDELFAQEISDYDRRQQAQGQFYAGLQSTSINGVVGLLGGMAAGAAAGRKDLDKVALGAAGSFISAIGMMLVQGGTAGLAAATLGGFFPFLRAAGLGGPEGAGAAAAALGVGLGMVAAGSAISGAASIRPTSSSSLGGFSGRAATGGFGGTEAPTGFRPLGAGAPEPSSVNIYFNGGIYGGSPEALGRELGDLVTGYQNRSVVRSNP